MRISGKYKNGVMWAAALVMALIWSLSFTAGAVAKGAGTESALGRAADYVCKATPGPEVGSVGGEWAVLGLARSGAGVPGEYYRAYYARVEKYAAECSGVLSDRKYTEYSRVILALTAIGKNPENVAGYNLLTPLGDFEKTVWQGINGPVWALIALDSGGYDMPQNTSAATQATREMYVAEILSRQLADGGWSLTGAGGSEESADADITAMALQALAGYVGTPEVAQAVDRALVCLSEKQNGSGGYSGWGAENSESVSQVIVALCELGIDMNDSRFVKNGCSLLDNLLSYQLADGSFRHLASGGPNQMATEQGLCAIAAAVRAQNGLSGLYSMDDAISIDGGNTDGEAGLPGKNPAVNVMPVTSPGVTFDDIANSKNKAAIESLASRGIINGMGADLFAPEETMTRAQFAAIIVRGLGLGAEYRGVFDDVAAGAWYALYVDTANYYGIVNGTGDGMFTPEGTITRQEAAVMTARAASLCGMDTSVLSETIRDTLAQFGDYVTAAPWAQESLAFCYRAGILDESEISIEPSRAARRGEIAQMLFNMLSGAKLI